jgi:hypothetical protein
LSVFINPVRRVFIRILKPFQSQGFRGREPISVVVISRPSEPTVLVGPELYLWARSPVTRVPACPSIWTLGRCRPRYCGGGSINPIGHRPARNCPARYTLAAECWRCLWYKKELNNDCGLRSGVSDVTRRRTRV